MITLKKLTVLLCLFFCCSGYSQNVGIGVPDPTEALSIWKGINIDHLNQNDGTSLVNGLRFGNTATTNQMAGISSNRAGGAPLYSLDFYTANQKRMVILANGAVGINTVPSAYILEVGGTIKTISNVRADGDVIAKDLIASTDITATDGDIKATNGDIKATNGQLSAGGKGVMMNNGAGRLKYVTLSATLSVAGLGVGSSVLGHISYSASTFSAIPSAYVGNVITPNGDYFKAMLVLENVTDTGIDVRVVNVSSTAITFTNAKWSVIAIGAY